jgi:hypothetical protein
VTVGFSLVSPIGRPRFAAGAKAASPSVIPAFNSDGPQITESAQGGTLSDPLPLCEDSNSLFVHLDSIFGHSRSLFGRSNLIFDHRRLVSSDPHFVFAHSKILFDRSDSI